VRVPFFYGWVVVAVAFVTMAIGVNARTAFSLLFPPVLKEFGWERGLTAGAFAFGFMVSTIFTPFLGRLMDRWGPRVVIPLGVVMVCAGLSLATFTRHPWQLYMTLGVLVAGGTTRARPSSFPTGSCGSEVSPRVSPSRGSAWDPSSCFPGCSE